MIFGCNIRQFLLKKPPAMMAVALLFAALIMPAAVVAQARFEVPVSVSDGPDTFTVYVGILPDAHFCIVDSDSLNGHQEVFLPPTPPSGIFDARMIWPRSGSNPACFDQGSSNDYRPFSAFTQKDTFKVGFQLGTGTTMVISWPPGLSSHFTQLTLRYFDQNLQENVNVDMLSNTSADVTNAPGIATILSGGLVVVVLPPPVPTLISPPDGSTGEPVPVTLRWNVSSLAQTYHVQVSTDSTFATTAVNDSTLTDTTRAATLQFGTTYYWRVRAKNTGGASPFSSRFVFATQFQPPPAPTLVSPPNGQTNTPTTLPLQWNAVSGALTYRLQVATSSTFTTGTIIRDDSTLTATVDTVGPLQNTTQYFWRVRATNSAGPGPYSTVWNFTTVATPPPAPGLLSPPDGAVNVSLVPTMTWSAAPTASSYHLQVARDSLFTILVVNDSTIGVTSRQIGQLLSSTLYYWRVSGKNSGGIGPYSTTFHFTTTEAPAAPFLVLPVDSATHLSATPAFVWTRVAGATAYQLQIATDATFGVLVVNDSTITDTMTTVSLPYGARLLWRVRARNTSGSSDPTSPRVFTIMLQPPGMPVQVAPANNLFDAPVTVTLRWTRVPLASGYEVPIAYDTLMTNLFADTTVADTFAVINVLPSTANYWRVRAYNIEHSFGPWTSVRRFTTGNVPPAIPTLISPAHGDTGVTRNPTFVWNGTPGALTYRLQVATNIGFPPTQLLFDDSTLTTTSFNAGVLPSRVSCFWRVRAKGTAGSSAYSLVFAFTTRTTTDVAAGPEETPSGFVLHQNYPNPFNPSTTIPVDIASSAFVTLTVYDLLGREVQTLVNEQMPAGTYSVRWNGVSAGGQLMPSGLYFVRMAAVTGQPAKSVVAIQKMLLLK